MADSGTYRYTARSSSPARFGENIGLQETEPDALIDSLQKGLPTKAFELLRESLSLSRAELAEALGISERTLARRLKAGRFSGEESERIYRLSRLLAQAADVLESDEAAGTWLDSPKVHLNGRTPLQYAGTEVGARVVERLLGRIEHGVFS